MTQVFRWYIRRIYPDGQDRARRVPYVDVKITPEASTSTSPKKRRAKAKTVGVPRARSKISVLKTDKLEWWEKDEMKHIYGRINEGSIIRVLKKQNMFPHCINITIPEEDRKLEEDMVFLQFVKSKTTWNRTFEGLVKKKGSLDLKPLIEIKDAEWIDFTFQARKLTKTLYMKVLGGGD